MINLSESYLKLRDNLHKAEILLSVEDFLGYCDITRSNASKNLSSYEFKLISNVIEKKRRAYNARF